MGMVIGVDSDDNINDRGDAVSEGTGCVEGMAVLLVVK